MKAYALLVAAGLAAPALATAQTPRTLRPDDVFALKDVEDPRVSPDGKWVAYTVTSLDAKEDESDTDIYMAPLAGGEPVRLTASRKSESKPRWSPDGRWLAFLSDREGKKTQVWLMSRAGGEAVQLTDYKASVSDLAWSPDSTRLALVVSDVDPDDPDLGEDAKAGQKEDKKKTPKPIVLRRLQFKRDTEGYLRDVRQHIHVLEVATKKTVQVTSGAFDDASPAWSPDGQWIAFVSTRAGEDADASRNSDIFVVSASGGTPRALVSAPGSDDAPAFSPDGKWVAYVAGGDPADMWYATTHLAVAPVAGGAPRPLSASLDRNVWTPRWSPDGRFVYARVEDGGIEWLARVPAGGGPVERAVTGERLVSAFDIGPKGELVVLESSPHQPAEVSLQTPGGLKRITRVNDEFLKGIKLGPVERFKAKSADGTMVDGFLVRPPDNPTGTRLPAILRIHGGPTSQYAAEFMFEWQVLAAAGYAVIGSNPRGSMGYGRDFSRAIWADWGNKDYEDVMAAVDHVVATGVADPDRLGVGGWSYGGILTDVVITKTDRFKAAVSGASMSNHLAGYGTDHYQHEWEKELGLPWKNPELWLRISPWYRIEKVKTPTLVVCGEKDMNVPLLASEQLYQALRRLGVPTELVIYPDQWHSIKTPSYQKDRYERYIAWYDRYVKGGAGAAPTAGAGNGGSGASRPEATSLLGKPLYPPPIAPDRRKTLEENLARARAEYEKEASADNLIWVGRRLGYLGRFREAIEVFTRGIEKFPGDFRLYRHRGHRYISVRELDKAVADLERATKLIEGVPDQVEPDGDPNPQNVPTSTSHFNIWYHLGLAHYLGGDFERALRAYRECLEYSKGSADRLVATSDWLYMTLRRLGRAEEAARVLEPIRADLPVIENHAYHHRLLLYRGEKKPEEILDAKTDDGVQLATQGYGVGNWHLYNGEREKARAIFRKVAEGPQWAAFGFIAAEAELARER